MFLKFLKSSNLTLSEITNFTKHINETYQRLSFPKKFMQQHELKVHKFSSPCRFFLATI